MKNVKGTLNTVKAVISPELRTSSGGSLKLLNASGNTLSIVASASQNSDVTLTLPAGTGANGQVLSSNGSGILNWINVSSFADSVTIIDNGTTLGVNQAGAFSWTGTHDWNPSTSQVNSIRLLKTSLTGTGRRDSDRILWQAKSYDGASHTIEARSFISLSGNDGVGSYLVFDGRVDGGFNQLLKIGISDGYINSNGANFGIASAVTGKINLYNANVNTSTSFQAGNAASSINYIFPSANQVAGKVLAISSINGVDATLDWITGTGYGAGLGLRTDLGSGTTLEIDPTYSNTFTAAQVINRGTTGAQDGLVLDINPPTTGGQIRESSVLRLRSRMRDAGASADRTVDFRFKVGAASQDGQGGYLKVQQRIDTGSYTDVFEIQQGAVIATGKLSTLAQLPNLSAGSLVGRSDSSGTAQEITLGTGLSLTGGILSASGVMTGTVATNQVPVGSASNVLNGSNNLTWATGTLTNTANSNTSVGVLSQNTNTGVAAEVAYLLNTSNISGQFYATSPNFTTLNLKKANQVGLYATASTVEILSEIANDAGKFIWGINTSELLRLAKTTGFTITSNSTTALSVGPTGSTNSVLKVDGSVSAPDGLLIAGTATGTGPALTVISVGANAPISITPKGTGDVILNGEVSSVSYRAKSKDLVDNTTTGLFEVVCDTSAAIGGTIHYTVQGYDGVDLFSASGIVKYAAVNKSGTISTNITSIGSEATAKSNGTVNIINTWSVLAGTNKITIRLGVASSNWLPTDIKVKFVIDNESTRKITLL